MNRHKRRTLRGRVETTRPAGDISPKVAASTGGSALGLVIAWVLTLIPGVNHAPPSVQAAMVLVVVGALTFAGGYIKRDRTGD